MIYTFGDGFAAGHIWPEWPQFIEVLTKQPVNNFGAVGAGNEFIFSSAIHAMISAEPNDIFLIQWTLSNRFDKIKQDSIWENLHQSDPVYKNISIKAFNNNWWLTSNSQLADIKNYHNFYIQDKQSDNRTLTYMISLANTLDSKKINYLYLSSYPLNRLFDHILFDECLKLNWLTLDSMEFFSRLFDNRGTEIQPSPIVHFEWCLLLLSKLNIPPLKNEDKIRSLIKSYKFEPYHPDREHIWSILKNEINMLL